MINSPGSLKILLTFLIIAIMLTPLMVAIAYLSAGFGHGNYIWAKILFPYTMIFAMIIGEISKYLIALMIAQFPIYGLILGIASLKDKCLKTALFMAAIHSSSVLACVLYRSDSF